MTGSVYYEQKECARLSITKQIGKKAIEKMLKEGLTEKEIYDVLESTLYEVLLDKLLVENADK